MNECDLRKITLYVGRYLGVVSIGVLPTLSEGFIELAVLWKSARGQFFEDGYLEIWQLCASR